MKSLSAGGRNMNVEKKVRLVQAFVGSVVLTLLMIPMGIMGYGKYTWMLFLPLLLFFAFGADFKKIPSMIICYVAGVAWGFLPGVLGNFLESLRVPLFIVQNLPPIVTIFLMLTVHENFLRLTLFGNIPSMFLGTASVFFLFSLQPDITPLHLIGFYLYGIFLSVCLVMGGGFVCCLIFGKETVFNINQNQNSKKQNSDDIRKS
jgi:hypothetical protein